MRLEITADLFLKMLADSLRAPEKLVPVSPNAAQTARTSLQDLIPAATIFGYMFGYWSVSHDGALACACRRVSSIAGRRARRARRHAVQL